jgi:AcrR family transcriptional regulator
MAARENLLDRVVAYATAHGIAGRSLRDIAAGVGTSHRMLLYHFGSHEGLLAAVVDVVEQRQREAMAGLAEATPGPGQLMADMWRRVSAPELRGSVRLFFEVFGLAVQGVPGTERMLTSLTRPWLVQGAAVAARLGLPPDTAGIRLGVAVSRGLLLDLLAGEDERDVAAAYQLFIDAYEAYLAAGTTPRVTSPPR